MKQHSSKLGNKITLYFVIGILVLVALFISVLIYNTINTVKDTLGQNGINIARNIATLVDTTAMSASSEEVLASMEQVAAIVNVAVEQTKSVAISADYQVSTVENLDKTIQTLQQSAEELQKAINQFNL